jgi:hypothetical protein
MAWFLSELKIDVDSELEATGRHAAVYARYPGRQALATSELTRTAAVAISLGSC